MISAATAAVLSIFLLRGAALPESRQEITLDSLRGAVALREGGRPVAAPFVDILAGYSFHWEIRIGEAIHIIAISRNLGGALFSFSANGSLLARREIQEVTSLQLFDFDEDGRPEIILDEIDGRGTGIVLRNFHIYRVTRRSIDHLWKGASYHRRILPPTVEGSRPVIDVLRGAIRCEPSGGGAKEARLLHFTERATGRKDPEVSRHAFAFLDGRFQQAQWPER